MILTYLHGPRYLVALPGLAFLTEDEPVARRVWSAAGSVGGAQDILVELVRDGLSTLGPFVLVDTQQDRVRVLVRGDLTAQVHQAEGTIEWAGTGFTTWAERVFDEVEAVRVGESGPAGDRFPLRVGVVRCAGFELGRPEPAGPSSTRDAADPPADRPEGSAEPAPPALSIAAPVLSPVIASAERTAEFVRSEPAVAVPAGSAPPAFPATEPPVPLDKQPLVKPPTLQVSSADSELVAESEREPQVEAQTEPELAPGPVPPLVSSPIGGPADPAQTRTENMDDGFDHLFESTIVRSVEDAAIRDVPDEEAPDRGPLGGDRRADPATRLGDHDGYTITGVQLGLLRQQRPEPESIDAGPRPGARLEMSTGDVVELERDVVIGRRPEVDRVQGGQVPTVVTVPSPRQDVSRTHLRIGWSGPKVLATDLHSMNGTVLTSADGTSRALDGGVPLQLAEGDVLDIGDGVTLTLRLTPA